MVVWLLLIKIEKCVWGDGLSKETRVGVFSGGGLAKSKKKEKTLVSKGLKKKEISALSPSSSSHYITNTKQ